MKLEVSQCFCFSLKTGALILSGLFTCGSLVFIWYGCFYLLKYPSLILGALAVAEGRKRVYFNEMFLTI